MPKTYIRVYRDASGTIKHVQENDNPITSEISERDANGVEQLVEFADGVVEFSGGEYKPMAREVFDSLDNDIKVKSGTRLAGMKVREPNVDEDKEFGPPKNLNRRSLSSGKK